MARKPHGSSNQPVQPALRWGCDAAVAEHICCFNRRLAEPRGYFESTRLEAHLLAHAEGEGATAEPFTFFDSTSGRKPRQLDVRPAAVLPCAAAALVLPCAAAALVLPCAAAALVLPWAAAVCPAAARLL